MSALSECQFERDRYRDERDALESENAVLKARADAAEALLERIAYAEHHTAQVNEWLRERRTGGK